MIPFISSGTSDFGLVPVFAFYVRGPKVSCKMKQYEEEIERRQRRRTRAGW